MVTHLVLGWPKSSFRFFNTSYRKTRMNLLVNPTDCWVRIWVQSVWVQGPCSYIPVLYFLSLSIHYLPFSHLNSNSLLTTSTWVTFHYLKSEFPLGAYRVGFNQYIQLVINWTSYINGGNVAQTSIAMEEFQQTSWNPRIGVWGIHELKCIWAISVFRAHGLGKTSVNSIHSFSY